MVATVHLADEANALRSLTNVKTIQITTGASPLVITPDENAPPLTIYEVTSGGTGTDEYIHLLQYPFTVGSFTNPQQINKRIIFIMVTQTNVIDVVHILNYDHTNTVLGNQIVIDAANNVVGRVASDVGGTLSFVGAPAAYAWFIDSWYVDLQSVDYDSNTNVQSSYRFASGYDFVTGVGKVAILTAGNAKSGSGNTGGEIQLASGAGDGAGGGGSALLIGGPGGATGPGGPISLTAGNGGTTSGPGGNIELSAGISQGAIDGGGSIIARAGGGSTSGGAIQLYGGESLIGAGGAIDIAAGSADSGDQNGGSVVITMGQKSGTGIPGQFQLANLPTTDPEIINSVWSMSGILIHNNGGDGSLYIQSAASTSITLDAIGGHIVVTPLGDFADDAAAATGGVPVNGMYRTASVIKVRVA